MVTKDQIKHNSYGCHELREISNDYGIIMRHTHNSVINLHACTLN